MQNYLKNTNYQSKQPNPTSTDKKKTLVSELLNWNIHTYSLTHTQKSSRQTSKILRLVESRHFLNILLGSFPTDPGSVLFVALRHNTIQSVSERANNRKRNFFLFPLHCSVFCFCLLQWKKKSKSGKISVPKTKKL